MKVKDSGTRLMRSTLGLMATDYTIRITAISDSTLCSTYLEIVNWDFVSLINDNIISDHIKRLPK